MPHYHFSRAEVDVHLNGRLVNVFDAYIYSIPLYYCGIKRWVARRTRHDYIIIVLGHTHQLPNINAIYIPCCFYFIFLYLRSKR